MTSKLALAVSKMEGFGIPGALPTRNNNPGDLRHAPGEMHSPDSPDAVGSFATPEEGWAELERQIQIDADRGLTLRTFVYTYAPPNENDSQRYLDFLCAQTNCSADTPLFQVLKQGETA